MADFEIKYDPITLNVNPSTVDIQGLDNAKATMTLATPQPVRAETKTELVLPQPFKTESKAEIVFPQPIKTESKAELDIKPLAFDQCLNLRFSALPPTCVRQPYQQHFGLTLFGVEIIGFNLAGETQTTITPVPSQPQVAWGGVHAVPPAAPTPPPAPPTTDPMTGGLRIKLG